MVRLNILSIIGLFFIFSACGFRVPSRVKKNFSFCYDSTTYYSNSKLNFNGYYVSSSLFDSPLHDWKTGKTTYEKVTLHSNIMFFSDGIFINSFIGGNDIASSSLFLENVSKNIKLETDIFYNKFKWGMFKIEGDTIKTQFVNRPSLLIAYWHLIEIWYKIRDGNKLEEIYINNSIENKELDQNSKTIEPFDFIETNFKLNSNTWLKNEKWFWCDDNEYKQWKQKQK